MLNSLNTKFKNLTVTLRFSILSIFIILFVAAILTLIFITYVRSSQTMTDLGFHLMGEGSSKAYAEIEDEMMSAEAKNISAANLLNMGVIKPGNLGAMHIFLSNIIQNEVVLFPIVDSAYWGDENGNFVMAEKLDNGSVQSEIINRSSNPPSRKIISRDVQGNINKIEQSTDLSFDPRLSPWYQTAKTATAARWVQIYKYRYANGLGTSVASPIFGENKKFFGVVTINARLDYIRKIVENIHIGKSGKVFLVSTSGKLIAFPGVSQVHNNAVMDIHALTAAPWIGASFDAFAQHGNEVFQLRFNKNNYLVNYQPLPRFGADHWLIGTVVPADDFIGALRKTNTYTSVLSLIILISGIVLISNLVSRVIRPLKILKHEIDKIKKFDLERSERIHSRIKEIGYIAEALFSMKMGLRTFQKYVPSMLVQQLIESGEDVRVGGVRKQLAILFTDIRSFTSLAEHIPPEQLTLHLCQYFDALSQIIIQQQGTIDKYIGDSIMAFWGAPLPVNGACEHAARAALLCIKRLNELNAEWQAAGKPEMFTRVGINLGDAIVGNFGSSERLSYTAIGDNINIASRLEDINKLYGTQIMVSEAVYKEISPQFMFRMVDCVTLKGKAETTFIYELVAEKQERLSYNLAAYNEVFARGFAAYQQRNWAEAIRLLSECKLIHPQDGVAAVFIDRCTRFESSPPPPEWNGVWHLR